MSATAELIWSPDRADDPDDWANSALQEAFGDAGPPPGTLDYLKSPEKPGSITALMYYGRSGSYFLQSFFDDVNHPRILTVNAWSQLQSLESVLRQDDLDEINSILVHHSKREDFRFILYQKIHAIINCFSGLFTQHDGVHRKDYASPPYQDFLKLFYYQVFSMKGRRFDYNSFLKLFYVSARLALGREIDYNNPVVFLWQAHTVTQGRKAWILNNFPNSKILIIARFPEKSFDSHLIHHAFESIQRPLEHLFNNLLFGLLTNSSTLMTPLSEHREKVVRFEDLHHHTLFVLNALCHWWGVPPIDAIASDKMTMNVRGEIVSGARKLRQAEYEPKILNYTDRIKFRYLLQEEYRAWGYEKLEFVDFERSLTAYENDPMISASPFSAHLFVCYSTHAEGGFDVADINAHLASNFVMERIRRRGDFSVTPLLYSLDALA